MEQTIINVLPVSEYKREFLDFMNLPKGISKNLKYQKMIHGKAYADANLCLKDDKIYYSTSLVTIKRGNAGTFYMVRKNKHGFTFDWKTKKVNIWYGKEVKETPHLYEVFQVLKYTAWFPKHLWSLLTKGGLERILAGKITNPRDYVKYYLSAIRMKDVSPSKFLDYAKECMNYEPGVSYPGPVFKYMHVAKHKDHVLDYLLSCKSYKDYEEKLYNYFSSMDDLVEQAIILEKPIDFTWSCKRFEQVHRDWTKEIMEYESSELSDVPYKNIFNLGEEFIQLKCDKDVFIEGKVMNHCLYTNYLRDIKQGKYVSFHVETQLYEPATLGVKVSDKTLVYDQMMHKYNSPVCRELKEFAIKAIMSYNQSIKQKNRV